MRGTLPDRLQTCHFFHVRRRFRTELLMSIQMTDPASTKQAAFDILTESMDDEVTQSLSAVHRVLEARLPARRLAIYEAGGGSTSYMPPTLLTRSDVTVVDVDAD